MQRLALAFIFAAAATPLAVCSATRAATAPTSDFIAGAQHARLTPLSFDGASVSGVALAARTNLVINQGIATHVDP